MKKFISLFAVIVLLFTGCTNSGTIKGENMKLVKDGKAHYIQLKDIIIDKNVNLKNTLKKEEFVIESTECKEKMRYIALVPSEFENGKIYPLVIFLHGLRDTPDNWINDAHIIENYMYEQNNKKIGDMVLIFPESGNEGKSWYADWKKEKEKNYESFIVKELIPEVEKRYPCGGSFEKRGIAGFSMGGHGAFKISLKHPEMFKATGSFAGALNIYRVSLSNRDGGIFNYIPLPTFIFSKKNENAQVFMGAFGTKAKDWKKENPYNLILEAKKFEKWKDKKYFIDVGEDDEANYHMTRQWNDIIKRISEEKLDYVSYIVEGQKHEWSYVELRLPAMLEFMWENLK